MWRLWNLRYAIRLLGCVRCSYLPLPPKAESDPVPLVTMNAYYSVGLDFSVANRIFAERKAKPGKPKTRWEGKQCLFHYF